MDTFDFDKENKPAGDAPLGQSAAAMNSSMTGMNTDSGSSSADTSEIENASNTEDLITQLNPGDDSYGSNGSIGTQDGAGGQGIFTGDNGQTSRIDGAVQ